LLSAFGDIAAGRQCRLCNNRHVCSGTVRRRLFDDDSPMENPEMGLVVGAGCGNDLCDFPRLPQPGSAAGFCQFFFLLTALLTSQKAVRLSHWRERPQVIKRVKTALVAVIKTEAKRVVAVRFYGRDADAGFRAHRRAATGNRSAMRATASLAQQSVRRDPGLAVRPDDFQHACRTLTRYFQGVDFRRQHRIKPQFPHPLARFPCRNRSVRRLSVQNPSLPGIPRGSALSVAAPNR